MDRLLRFLPSSSPSIPNLHYLLTRCSTLNHLTQTHAFMVRRGLDQDNLLLSKLIDASSLLGFSDYPRFLFQRKAKPNTYLFNTMIRIKDSDPKVSIFLFNAIRLAGCRPDTYSFPYVLKAVASLSDLELVQGIHGQIIRVGFVSDVHISTALIQTYSACNGICHARILFDEMTNRDVVVWNAMISAYVKLGDAGEARALFDTMPERRNVISWTTMIAGYAQMNRPNDSIEIFRRMQVEGGIEPDEIALLAALSACSQLGALDLGEWVHGFIDKRGLHKIVSLMNALIDMYAKSGNVEKALEVFEGMRRRSVVTWTTMIAGFSLHGHGARALGMFRRMERENVQPNGVTFLAILSACSHVGRTDLGRWYFDRMRSRYGMRPRIEHYGCMVDLLGRAGCMREAHELIEGMPFEANGAIWGALLAAARIHGDVEIGEKALRHLMEVEPHNSGNYTLLSNIYAAKEKWDDVGKMRKAMKDRGVMKMTGGSCIEIDGNVHEFTCRDGAHPHFKRIHQVLHEINGQLKLVGCLEEPFL